MPKGLEVPTTLNKKRNKRSTNENSNINAKEFEHEDDEDSVFIFVYEPTFATKSSDENVSSTKSSCGIKPSNINRLKTPSLATMDELRNVTTLLNIKQLRHRSFFHTKKLIELNRSKRKVINSKTNDKVIELAVFVDDDLYKITKKETDKTGEDPIERIQDIVYAYLNAVSNFSMSKY